MNFDFLECQISDTNTPPAKPESIYNYKNDHCLIKQETSFPESGFDHNEELMGEMDSIEGMNFGTCKFRKRRSSYPLLHFSPISFPDKEFLDNYLENFKDKEKLPVLIFISPPNVISDYVFFKKEIIVIPIVRGFSTLLEFLKMKTSKEVKEELFMAITNYFFDLSTINNKLPYSHIKLEQILIKRTDSGFKPLFVGLLQKKKEDHSLLSWAFELGLFGLRLFCHPLEITDTDIENIFILKNIKFNTFLIGKNVSPETPFPPIIEEMIKKKQEKCLTMFFKSKGKSFQGPSEE